MALTLGAIGCSSPSATPPPAAAKSQPAAPTPSQAQPASAIPLIAANMTLVTASEIPANPLTDATLDQSTLSNEIRWGFRLFMNTPAEAPKLAPGQVSCTNCHLNGGQRERAMPLVDIAGMFPEYNRRAGRLISLNDRIVECFLRSENATGTLTRRTSAAKAKANAGASTSTLPTATSREVLAISAYLTWLSRGSTMGKNPAWRGQNAIATAAQIPLDKLDPAKGEAIYRERCTACHGVDGEGILIAERKPGPLWGPNSWNDGAGAARVYTLAGIIRYTMPYVAPGTLTDEEAQLLAAFITSKPRPAFPFKDQDYRVDPLPRDAVYYPRR